MKLYKNLIPLFSMFVCLFFMLVLSVRGAESIRCQGDSPYHLQGVSADKDFIYWSFTTILYKTDWTGKVLVKKDVLMHHGDLCVHDGKLYVTAALPLPSKNGKPCYNPNIYVYDCKDLTLVKKFNLTGITTVGLDGIDFHNGHFYIGDDKGKTTDIKFNTILVFTPDFKLVDKKKVPGWTWFGVQTITWAHDSFWFGNYGRENKTPTKQMNENFQLTGEYAIDISVGAVPLPKSPAGEPRILQARIVKTPEGKHSAELIPLVLRNGKLIQE